MNYRLPLTEEEVAAYASMPKTAAGFVISLFYVPPAQVAAYEADWRTWLGSHPKHLWPNWVSAWAETRKTEARK